MGKVTSIEETEKHGQLSLQSGQPDETKGDEGRTNPELDKTDGEDTRRFPLSKIAEYIVIGIRVHRGNRNLSSLCLADFSTEQGHVHNINELMQEIRIYLSENP